MKRPPSASVFPFAALLALVTPGPARGEPPKSEGPVAAVVVTSLGTGSKQIRQFAFDGDPKTYFASAEDPTTDDPFALVFDRPVSVRSVAVTTGRPEGRGKLDAGVLEVSADGKTFTDTATFSNGKARADLAGKEVLAVRLRPTARLTHSLAVAEIEVDSAPPVTRFAYPIEFAVDVSDAPEMKGWAEEVARLCERWYPRLNEELKSDGYRPARFITLTLSTRYKGVAAANAGAATIVGSVQYFKDHPRDVGAMIHETIHIVQNYRGPGNPGWLVEGIADYVRYYIFEPGSRRRLNPDRARYDASYGVTAAFLAYVSDTHDKDLVLKLNRLMRYGRYKDDAFKELTGKTLKELDEEWRASLKR